jgi:hypothetical protein
MGPVNGDLDLLSSTAGGAGLTSGPAPAFA